MNTRNGKPFVIRWCNVQIDIDDIEKFNTHFVKPMVDAVRSEVRDSMIPLIQDVKDLKIGAESTKGRLDKLEGDQKKAMVGYAVFSAGLAAAIGAAWGWIKSHLKFS
jgi:hypothetical protein